MPIIATAGSGQTYAPAPEGTHQGVCVDAIDKGVLEVTYAGKSKKQHKIVLAWQINELRDDGTRFLVFKRYTCSLHEMARLRKDLESWRGKKFTREEEMGFDVESVIGANCLLNIQHNVVGDKTYANVTAVMALPKGMPKLIVADGYVREQDREPTNSSHDPSDAGPLTVDDIPF